MEEVVYEYGQLYQYEKWEELKWIFSHGKHEYTEFGQNDTLIECMNRLGESSWKLSLKTDNDEYIFIRKKK